VFKDLLNTFSQGLFWQPGKEKKRKLLKLQSSNETLASSIKQSTQPRGKGRERERSKVATKGQSNKLCSKAPHCHKKHLQKEKENLKKRISI